MTPSSQTHPQNPAQPILQEQQFLFTSHARSTNQPSSQPIPPSSPRHPLASRLRTLSDSQLLTETTQAVLAERDATTALLWHIVEIQRRGLHVAAGYPSLHTYLVQHHGLSDGAAHRRIAAARLLAELPREVEASLQSGRTNLTTVAALQDFVQAQKKHAHTLYTPDHKRELLQAIEHKSRQDVDLLFTQINPERVNQRPEHSRIVSDQGDQEIRFTADKALLAKLQRLRELLAHQIKDSSHQALLHAVADQLLRRMDPLHESKTKKKQTNNQGNGLGTESKKQQTTEPHRQGLISKQATEQRKELAREHKPEHKNGQEIGKCATQNLTSPSPKKLSSHAVVKEQMPFVAETKTAIETERETPPHASQPSQPTAASPSKPASISKDMPADRLTAQSLGPLTEMPKPKPKPTPNPTNQYPGNPPTRFIPAAVKQAVYRRDQGQCTYTDPRTQHRCGTRFALQYDHRIPFCAGGPSTVDNLRLLCATHNRHRTRQFEGTGLQ